MSKSVEERIADLLEYCDAECERLQSIRVSGVSDYENARAIGGIEAMGRVAKKVAAIQSAVIRSR